MTDKEHACKDDCECHEKKHNHQVSAEDLARHNNFLLNVLMGVLIDKKHLSEEDIQKKAEEMQKEMMAGQEAAKKAD